MRDPMTQLFIKDNISWYFTILFMPVLIAIFFYKRLSGQLDKVLQTTTRAEIWIDTVITKEYFLFVLITIGLTALLMIVHMQILFERERSPERILFTAHLPYKKKQIFFKIWWTNYIVYGIAYGMFAVLSIFSVHTLTSQYDTLLVQEEVLSSIPVTAVFGFIVVSLIYGIVMLCQSNFISPAVASVFSVIATWTFNLYFEAINGFFVKYRVDLPIPSGTKLFEHLKPFRHFLQQIISGFYDGGKETVLGMKDIFGTPKLRGYSDLFIGGKSDGAGAIEQYIDGEWRVDTFYESFQVEQAKELFSQHTYIYIGIFAVFFIVITLWSISIFGKNEYSKPEEYFMMVGIPRTGLYAGGALASGLIAALLLPGHDLTQGVVRLFAGMAVGYVLGVIIYKVSMKAVQKIDTMISSKKKNKAAI